MTALRILSFWISPVVLSISVFGFYVLFNGELSAQKAFVTFTTLMIIQGPIFNVGSLLNDLLQGQVSLERIEKFMFSEEINVEYIKHNNQNNSQNNTAIKMTNGNFYWTQEQAKMGNHKAPSETELQPRQEDAGKKHQLILNSINIEIKKGSFVAILGE